MGRGECLFLLMLIFSFTYAQAVVNINTASVEALKRLPHIGLVKAKAIEEYRRVHGAFKSKEDITKVKGIGLKTYEKLKNEISVVDVAKQSNSNNAAHAITYRKAIPITQLK